MQIDVKIDAAPLFLRLANGQRRLAYAVVNAINNTVKRVQHAEFIEIQEAFEIRKPQFFFGTPGRPGGTAARIKPFASVKQGRPFAEIAVQAPEGRGLVSRRTLLPYYEKGGVRPIFTPGAHEVAVPITGSAARPSWASSVPQELTFAGMHMVAYRAGKRVRRAGQRKSRQGQSLYGTGGRFKIPTQGQTQWKGKARTFILLDAGPELKSGVFQRTGRGEIRMLYRFARPRELVRRLHWIDTARRTADQWFGEEMERQVIDAIQHDRGRSL